MSAADKLARLGAVLAEHEKWDIAEKEPHYWAARCQCGEWVALHRQHVAAVVLAHLTAEGWAQGHEEFATKDDEDEGVTEIEPPTREWAERVAAADNAYLRRTGFEPNITVVRRRVTDWEPVETGDQK